MPLPSDLVTVKITGSFPLIDGDPQDGTVTFDPGTILFDAAGQTILTGAATTQIRGSVMIPITLPATDNPNLKPAGWSYTVSTHLGNRLESCTVSLPSSVGSVVDLADLRP